MPVQIKISRTSVTERVSRISGMLAVLEREFNPGGTVNGGDSFGKHFRGKEIEWLVLVHLAMAEPFREVPRIGQLRKYFEEKEKLLKLLEKKLHQFDFDRPFVADAVERIARTS